MSALVSALVVPDGADRETRSTLAALERQTRAPDSVALAEGAVGPSAALAGGAQWLWLLDGSAVPEPDALEQLVAALEPLDALARPGAADPPQLPTPPVLLASRIVTADGTLDRRSLPVPEVVRADLVVAAYDRGQVALRLARRGSLLVHRCAFEDGAAPCSALPLRDDLAAWTARLLRDRLGLLVPGSVAVRDCAGARARDGAGALRLLTGDALAPRERPWFAFRLAEAGVAAARARLGRVAGAGRGAPHRGRRA